MGWKVGGAPAAPDLRDQTAEAIPRNHGCYGSFNDECAASLKEDGDMAVAGHGNGPESLARLRRQGDKSGIARSQSRSMARRVTPTFAPMQPLPSWRSTSGWAGEHPVYDPLAGQRRADRKRVV